jgi:hypothetical protein
MDGTTARGCSSSRPRPRPPPSTSPKAPPFHVCAVTLRLIYPGPRRWGFYCLPTACAEDTFGLYRAQPRPRLYVHRARNIAAASRLARTGALATPPWHQHTSTRASARHHDRCHRVTSPRQSSPSRTVGKSRPCCPIPWGPDVDAYLTRGQQPLPAGRALFFHGMAAPVLRRRSCDAPRTPAGRRKPRSSAASPATSTTRSNLRNPVGANLDVDNILP